MIISPSISSPQQDAIHFLVAFILAISLIAIDRYGEMANQVRSALLAGLTPIEQIAAYSKNVFRSLDADRLANLDELKRQNELLATEVLLLKARQQQFVNLQQEVTRLEALLGTTGKVVDHKIQIATVTQFSSNPISQYMTLSEGSDDQVEPQNTVIDANGVIGQIVHTTPFSSRVMLITDPEHHLPVRIQRTSQRGILSGLGYDQTSLRFVPQNSSVQIGDIIETSGLGGVFPSGYPVATITQIERIDSAPYLTITAQPVSEFNKSHKVLILKHQKVPPKELKTDLNYDLKQPNTAIEPIVPLVQGSER